MKNLGMQNIETQRLVLRKFTLKDADDMFRNWANDGEVTKFLTCPTHSDIEVSKKVFKLHSKSCISADHQSDDIHDFIFILWNCFPIFIV